MDRLEALGSRDSAVVRQFALEHGYVWLQSAIEPRTIDALAALVDDAWTTAPGDLLALHRIVLPSPELERLRRHPAILNALRAILGPSEPAQGDVVRYVLPGDEPTPAHQDASYVGVAPPLYSTWIPLGDCPLALGPIALWPGSHKLGLMPHGAAGLDTGAGGQARWAAADLLRGDVLLLDSLTAHKALPNRSQRPRRSVDLRYRPAV